MFLDDTIAAIATAPGIGGIGIIRVSGPEACDVVNRIFHSKQSVPLGERKTRTIHYGHIVHPKTGKTLDEVIVVLMKGPHSYTAEDVVEIQCHGGFVSVREILKVLLSEGVRQAEEGEFTKRAFLNGRIDLTQAEAIIDIIDAKTEQSLEVAVNQLDGTLSKYIRALRDELIAMIAHLEVTIDYPEEDIEDVSAQEVRTGLEPILEKMDTLLATAQRGKLLRDGVMVSIIGRPNAGKSSLMNALLREDRAIVTNIPGTTRDSIEEFLTIQGIPVRLIDTAGIRETEDIVESMGVEKARQYLDKADVVVLVIDGSKPLEPEEQELLQLITNRPSIIFLNKADQAQCVSKEEIAALGTFTEIVTISAAQGEGMDEMARVITSLVQGGAVQASHEVMLSNVRHITLMEQAKVSLDQSILAIDSGMPIDLIVTDIRAAWELLGDITGESLRESMVDELFKRFCLGK